MILFENGSHFELTVIGYEYPESQDVDDANWLIVRIAAEYSGISWTAEDSCLRTFELVRLREWLESVKEGELIDSEIAFTENELGFRYESQSGVLAIILDFRFHPKGDAYDYDVDDEYVVEFHVTSKQLSSLIDSLDRYIRKFPERFT